MASRILLINGPNLNLLGTREPQIYGSTTLADVVSTAESQAKSLGVTLESFQSNHEGAIVDRIQEAAGFGPNGHQNKEGKVSAIIINPGAYTHTSVAYVISLYFMILSHCIFQFFCGTTDLVDHPPPFSPTSELLDSAHWTTHMTDTYQYKGRAAGRGDTLCGGPRVECTRQGGMAETQLLQ